MDRYGNPFSRYRVYPPDSLPPLRSVRRKCLDCCLELAEEVRACYIEQCSLWPFRLGSYPEDHQGPRSVLKPIRAKCLDCAGDRAEVRRCIKKCCPLFPFRMGHNSRITRKGPTLPPRITPGNSKTPFHEHENDL